MTAVIGIVNYNGKVLIGKKRGDSPKKLAGQWHIPGERVEDGESDSQALARGINEETGLVIRVGRYLGKSITPTSHSEARWYECFSYTDKIFDENLKSDLEDVMWVERNEVSKYVSPLDESLWPKEVRKYLAH